MQLGQMDATSIGGNYRLRRARTIAATCSVAEVVAAAIRPNDSQRSRNGSSASAVATVTAKSESSVYEASSVIELVEIHREDDRRFSVVQAPVQDPSPTVVNDQVIPGQVAVVRNVVHPAKILPIGTRSVPAFRATIAEVEDGSRQSGGGTTHRLGGTVFEPTQVRAEGDKHVALSRDERQVPSGSVWRIGPIS